MTAIGFANRRAFRLALILLVPFAFCGCRSSEPAVVSGPPFVEQGADLKHAASGMVFPSAALGFAREMPRVYDNTGRDISVGYNLTGAAGAIVATVYVYPAPALTSFGSSDNVVADARAHLTRGEFDRRKQEVLQVHPAAVLLREGQVAFPAGGAGDGWKAEYSLTETIGGISGPVRSQLFVFCYVGQGWALEYRFSYPESFAAQPKIDAFMNGLHITIPK
jgi:hypothetical protein